MENKCANLQAEFYCKYSFLLCSLISVEVMSFKNPEKKHEISCNFAVCFYSFSNKWRSRYTSKYLPEGEQTRNKINIMQPKAAYFNGYQNPKKIHRMNKPHMNLFATLTNPEKTISRSLTLCFL